MIRVKDDSVCIARLSPAIYFALMVANEVYSRYGYEVVITSGDDGVHSSTSLHYNGDAVDIRTKMMPEKHAYDIAAELNAALGKDFDVIFENTDQNEHIHIEKQPRRRV